MPQAIPTHDPGAREALREQYELECALADDLRRADVQGRRHLYGAIYEKFVERTSTEPRRPGADGDSHEEVRLQMQLLRPYLASAQTFLEVGAGDLALSRAIARHVESVTAVEPCQSLWRNVAAPPNVRVVADVGPPLAVPTGSVDVAFSCHVIEHLHPEDAVAHLREMVRALRRGGWYLCVTPNRLYGPHDVSRFFADEPRGLHLQEYGYRELSRLFLASGFRRVAALRGVGRPPRERSLRPYRWVEACLFRLSPVARRRLIDWVSQRRAAPFRPLEQVVLLGER